MTSQWEEVLLSRVPTRTRKVAARMAPALSGFHATLLAPQSLDGRCALGVPRSCGPQDRNTQDARSKTCRKASRRES